MGSFLTSKGIATLSEEFLNETAGREWRVPSHIGNEL